MRGGEDAHQFVTLFHQGGKFLRREHSCFDDYFQPKESFIRFFQNNTDFIPKVRIRTRP